MKPFAISVLITLLLSAGLHAQINKTYYKSGQLKSISHEGSFNGCHTIIGTDSIFYSNGRLMMTTEYDNQPDKVNEGCHSTWTIETTHQYYKNGKLKSTSQNKHTYEGTPCNCGYWMYYNSSGALIKKAVYGDCYDQKPCED